MTYVASLAGIFELIFADLLFKLIFADSSSQPFPPPFFFWGGGGVCVSIGSGEYFQLNSFRVTVPVGGCMQGGGGPAGRVAMDTSLLCLRCSGSVQPLRYQFPRSSIGDESN